MTTMAAWIAAWATRDGVIVPCVIEGALDEIGIPPDMDVDTLRRRLLWGERVEDWRRRDVPVPFGRDYDEFSPEGNAWGEGVDDAMNWIDRPAEDDEA